MNWFDVLLLIPVAISIVSGVRDGLSRSGFGFLAVIIAFLAAAWLFPANAVRFLIVFVALVCAGMAAAFVLGKWFKSVGLSWLDRLLGGVFGLMNAGLFSVVVVLALMAFAPKIPRHYAGRSALAPYALEAACRAAEVVPDELKSRVEETYDGLANLLPPKFRRAVPPLPHKI